jgi:hypothetical protein
MASIRSQDDWWKSANETLPRLPEYALENGCDWNVAKAELALREKDWRKLSSMFERLWADLPDSPSIRYGAFGDLCDLCSEIWVFTDTLSEQDMEALEAYHSD